MKIFQKQSQEHQLTHGIHSAALASRDKILISRDDIGRHNAIDKVIGEALYTNICFTDKILLTSGRISSEILSKALRCRMSVLAAIVGLVRGAKMFIYSSEERIC